MVSALGRLAVACVLVGASALVGRYLAEDPSWRVHEVSFVGSARASAAELRHLSDIRDGSHLLTVDLDRAAAGVQRHPWVASASARRVYPGAVEITVQERTPVLLLALDRLWYVDSAGVVFKPAVSDDLDYPVLSGLDPKLAADRPDLGQAVVSGALRLQRAWAARGSADADLSEICFHPAHGYELVLRSGSRLMVGEGDPSVPLAKLDRLIAAGLDLQTPQRIDLDMEHVAVATPLPTIDAMLHPPAPPPSPLSPDSPQSADPASQGGTAVGGPSHD